jgi:hypothetical protein
VTRFRIDSRRTVAQLALTMAAIVLLTRPVLSDDTPENTSGKALPRAAAKIDKAAVKPNASVVPMSPDREAAVVLFAHENHAELAALLDGLKRNAPREYQAALVDLDRAVERLSKIREKSTERHAVELAEWKITSRIRLLAARLTMSADPTVEAELRAALRERLQLRLSAQRAERDRLQVRVTRLDQQIEEMTSKENAIVEKQFVELQKSLPVPRPAAKTKPKKPATPVDAKGEKP